MIAAKTKATSKPKLGPLDHGRRMTLKTFEFAEVEEGCVAELARGYVIMSEVPNYSHAALVGDLRDHLGRYRLDHPGTVHRILEGSSGKLVIPDWESERHPDVAVYLAAPKGRWNRTMWRTWVPELAIEVVSESSRDRDYTEKRDEYRTLGVKEYWIVDAGVQRILVLRRGRSQWTEKALGPADVIETKLLPGFKLPCKAVFDAATEPE
ncbi:MAG: Uma2 family endonuclease [Gemmataceae bacterium]|nr:Uma2 family endonuclease [Gemmataceae bacterium]